ncbi:MAG: hypothetical protein LAO30_11770 [Acidobacteriia bacterium]|nr:hypothetical protein [Terriglobia bacterium]
MKRNRQWKYTLSLLTIMSCLLLCGCPPAQLTATLSSSPADYRGDCPGVVTFNGTVTSDKAQIVTYIFTRSDGAIDSNPKTLTFTGAGSKTVSTTWTLGGDGLPHYAGWEAIKITQPSVVTSNQANFELRCNPPANSILAAHGNTDWHINTANEFLFGKNMGGTVTAQHHAPDTWSKTHIHVGLTNTAKYYYDPALTNTGADTNIPNGIDRTMLFFYAGHGNPLIWNTLGDSATQSDVRLANVTGGGNLRYYWQCSCEVFAHGPETCNPATTFSYACPDKFNGAADSASMRNVFQRWGPALTPDLRMACGGSTEMYCWTQQVDRAWSDYGNGSVVHMFLDGFGEAGARGVVPLCMTLGGNDITKTPLYDNDFTNAPNTSGNTHYYLMYPSGTQQRTVSLSPAQIPQQLQRFRLTPAPPPLKFSKALEKGGPAQQITSKLLAGGEAKLERIPQTGALHLDSGQIAEPSLKVLPEKEYIERAATFLSEQGLAEQQTAEPLVTRYMTASMPVNGQSSEMQQAQAGVTVVYKRVIQANGVPLEVLGAPGSIRVELNNDGAVLKVSKLWRTLEPVGSPVAVKNFEQARSEAMRELGAPDGYTLDSWKLGYKQESVKEGQDELAPVYQFAFIAVKAHDTEHPPQLIEVSALKQ